MNDFGGRRFSKKKTVDYDELAKWSRYWYQKLRDFHRAGAGWDWRFSEANVIEFLRHLLANETPVWKRLKAVENLCWYREHVLKVDEPTLDFVRRKLNELNELSKIQERGKSDAGFDDLPMTMADIEEIAGTIEGNPSKDQAGA